MIGSELLSDRVEASRGMETVQVASRAVPVLGPTAEQGVRAAMANQGSWGIFFSWGSPQPLGGTFRQLDTKHVSRSVFVKLVPHSDVCVLLVVCCWSLQRSHQRSN